MVTFQVNLIVPDEYAHEASAALCRDHLVLLSMMADLVSDNIGVDTTGFGAELVYDPTGDPHSGVFEDLQTVTPEDDEDIEEGNSDLAAGRTVPLDEAFEDD